MSGENRSDELNSAKARGPTTTPKTEAGKTEGGKKRRPGRPAHEGPLKKHMVSTPGDLWQWALLEPEGASALVRVLLERERIRRTSPFFEVAMAGGPQFLEVKTPWGGVTVHEIPGRGVMLLRDDDQLHNVSYMADENGWRYTFSERMLSGLQLSYTHRYPVVQDGTTGAPGDTGGTDED